jgi:RNA polymerase sigma-70 factor (ECF subfamily)
MTVTSKNLDEFSEAASEKTSVDQTQRIWDAVKCLKAEHSEVIHLRFAAGLSYEQISQALGIPVGTVRSRLHRGLKDIRERIGVRENET